ncbi:MAG: hypothetical protein CMJ59_14650 [Planctomycetaceae bacterium]|nr:hypothetical protein [Planctomycetaceae bacterium]
MVKYFAQRLVQRCSQTVWSSPHRAQATPSFVARERTGLQPDCDKLQPDADSFPKTVPASL